MNSLTRRRLITTGLATTAGVAGLAAADRIAKRYGLIPPDHCGKFGAGETLTYAAQRILVGDAPAREFRRDQISKAPFANEVEKPTPAFLQLQAGGFRDWRLQVDGMVAHPLSLSVSEIKSMGMGRHITEIACEEGWSYVAEWIGTPLHLVLREAGVLPEAKYLVYYGVEKWAWDSLDMPEAMHPQTLVTWAMNDSDLGVPFGGPLRMRVPRQLGYKNLKFLTRITATDSMKKFGKGLGSSSPESGYSWYAGI